MSSDPLTGPWPYLVVVLVGFLPTELWRSLAVVLSRGLDERSEILVWVRAVAATLLAGVVAKLLYGPTGALATVPFWGRGGAMLVGLSAFFAFRRSVIAGVMAGEAALVAAAWFASR
jgi:hypothetical protein